MQEFMGDNFLLDTPSAVRLYHQYAAAMPIVDYHCHIDPKQIYEDQHFDNIFQVWLAGDHYKWRLMRSNGVPEEYITGSKPDREKFQMFAEALPRAIGNPMYHWCHLELKRYFGYEGVLNGDTAQKVWDLTVELLQKPDMGVRGLIKKSNVAFIGTTDDPTDSLIWHEKLQNDSTIDTVVAPSFRPDKAINIDKPGFVEYIHKLSQVTDIDICDIESVKKALSNRIEYFHNHGCKASDHGLDRTVYTQGTEAEATAALRTVLSGGAITQDQADIYKTQLLIHCACEYEHRGWAMQVHYNCMRNTNSSMFRLLGPDTGFDCIGPDNGVHRLAKFLDALNREGKLPKTILYSLDGGDDAALVSMIGSFQGPGIRGKLQHGSAWWFNDNYAGMRQQLINLGNLGILGNFIGMLTDSRSFLSYTRHEYFRRILCQLIGQWIENGEYPADFEYVGSLVQDICYRNAQAYFNINTKF